MRHFLQVLEYRLGKIVVLELHERVDEFNAKVLSEELKTILNTGRKKIIIELSKCTYLSASCLATLWKRQREARREGGDLVLVAASGKVLETIHSVNLDRVIRRYYTLPEASLGPQEEPLEKQSQKSKEVDPEPSGEKNSFVLFIKKVIRQILEKTGLFLFFLWLPPHFATPGYATDFDSPTYTKPYSLDEVLNLAKQVSPQIRLSRLKMEERHLDVVAAKSYLFPRIMGTTGYLYQSNPSLVNEIINRELTNAYTVDTDAPDALRTRTKSQLQNNLAVMGLGFSQLVYSGGLFSSIVKLKESQIMEADAVVSIETMNIEEQVRTLYVNLLLLKEKITLLEAKQAAIQNRLKSAQKARSAKVISESQLAEIEISDLKNHQELLGAIQEESSIRGLLNIMIGHPTQAPINLTQIVNPDSNVNIQSVEDYFASAVQKYPEIKRSQSLMDSASAQSQMVAAQKAWSPQVVVFGSGEWVQGLGNKAKDGFSWSLGTALVMTLYDGPKSAAEVEKSVSMAQQARIVYEEAERKLKIEIADTVSHLKLAYLAKQTANRALGLAADRKLQAQSAVKEGQLPEFRLAEAQTAEIEAKINIIAADAQILKQLSKLKMLVGKP